MNYLILSVPLFLFGIGFIAFGLCRIFSDSLNEWFKHKFPDSELDKKLISPRGRDFMGRYLASIGFVWIGAILILFAIVNYIYK